MDPHTIVHMDDFVPVSRYGSTFTEIKTRVETLRKYAATQHVPMALLSAPDGDRIAQDVFLHLRDRIERDIAAAGRQAHGDITISRHEDFMRDAMTFRAEVLTRERTDGTWAEVWAARRQDADDLLHNIDTEDDE